jgi:hypothetical protein
MAESWSVSAHTEFPVHVPKPSGSQRFQILFGKALKALFLVKTAGAGRFLPQWSGTLM